MATSLHRDLQFLILKYLREENLDGTFRKYVDTLSFSFSSYMVDRFGQEAGIFFDWDYFSGLVMNGSWEEVDEYANGFWKLEYDSPPIAVRVHFLVKKQKYFEALIKYPNSQENPHTIKIIHSQIK